MCASVLDAVARRADARSHDATTHLANTSAMPECNLVFTDSASRPETRAASRIHSFGRYIWHAVQICRPVTGIIASETNAGMCPGVACGCGADFLGRKGSSGKRLVGSLAWCPTRGLHHAAGHTVLHPPLEVSR